MIYLEQKFNVEPASPAGLDQFITVAEESLVPAWASADGRLVGAWSSTEDWFYQVTQVTAFDDLAAFDRARRLVAEDEAAADVRAALASIAPIYTESLLEPLGPVSPDTLDAAIAASADAPVGVYSFAILDVLAGRMQDFENLLAVGAKNVPIIAAWRDVAGNPNQVIDLWQGDPVGRPHQPNAPGMDAFFGPLRQVAPKERTVRLFPLPYSPLR